MDDNYSSPVPIYRAVGLNEDRDIELTGGFRCLPGYGFDGGTWFAMSFEDAERWGLAFQRFSQRRPFRVVAAWLPSDSVSEVEFHEQWDAIGPAYFVREDQLPILSQAGGITFYNAMFEEEENSR